MMKHLKYLKYVLVHKWYVFLKCCHLGIPLQGIIHDWTKFLPSEWFGYVNNFYGGTAPLPEEAQQRRDEFDKAWNFHQKRNPHHWQFWVVAFDDGGTKCIQMPHHVVLEMLADWYGAGMAINGKDDVPGWYKKNRQRIHLHTSTRYLVEKILGFYYTSNGVEYNMLDV